MIDLDITSIDTCLIPSVALPWRRLMKMIMKRTILTAAVLTALAFGVVYADNAKTAPAKDSPKPACCAAKNSEQGMGGCCASASGKGGCCKGKKPASLQSPKAADSRK